MTDSRKIAGYATANPAAWTRPVGSVAQAPPTDSERRFLQEMLGRMPPSVQVRLQRAWQKPKSAGVSEESIMNPAPVRQIGLTEEDMQSLQRLIKLGFVPMGPEGATAPPPMDPAAMGAPAPADPSMMGAPPGAPPMDPAAMGAPPGAPPMDPAAMGAPAPMTPVMLTMEDLIQLFVMIRDGQLPGVPGGEGGEKGKGKKGGEVDALVSSVQQLVTMLGGGAPSGGAGMPGMPPTAMPPAPGMPPGGMQVQASAIEDDGEDAEVRAKVAALLPKGRQPVRDHAQFLAGLVQTLRGR